MAHSDFHQAAEMGSGSGMRDRGGKIAAPSQPCPSGTTTPTPAPLCVASGVPSSLKPLA